MTEKDLDLILDGFSWIKVKKFDPKQGSVEELEKHHVEETQFLIDKCRELATSLKLCRKNNRQLRSRLDSYSSNVRRTYQDNHDYLPYEEREDYDR